MPTHTLISELETEPAEYSAYLTLPTAGRLALSWGSQRNLPALVFDHARDSTNAHEDKVAFAVAMGISTNKKHKVQRPWYAGALHRLLAAMKR